MYNNLFSVYTMVEPPPGYDESDELNINTTDNMLTVDYQPLDELNLDNEAEFDFSLVVMPEVLTYAEEEPIETEEIQEEIPEETSKEKVLPVNTTKKGKFLNRTDFFKTMLQGMRYALSQNNLSTAWAPMLVASAAVESGYGTKLSGSYNYGGVTVPRNKLNKISHTVSNNAALWTKLKGNYRGREYFRNFSSVLDYCNYLVGLLKNSNRYKAAFTSYSPSQMTLAWEYILRRGYGGGSDSNIRIYVNSVGKIINKIKSLGL